MAKLTEIDWLRERVRMKHHQAVTRWLTRATPAELAEAEEAGLGPNDCLRAAYDVRNGLTTVPQCAMKLLRMLGPERIDPRLVTALCLRRHGIPDQGSPPIRDERQGRALLALLQRMAAKGQVAEELVREYGADLEADEALHEVYYS